MSRLALQKHVVILCLPPHTTPRLQPLDVSVIKPVSNTFAEVSTALIRSGRRLLEQDIAGMMSLAHQRSATPKNIQAGFRATGIYPLNRNIFSSTDFAGTELSERPNSAAKLQNVSIVTLEKSMSDLSIEKKPNVDQLLRESPVHLPLNNEPHQ